MWFKKKKEQPEQKIIPCSTDKNLTECDSISIIRDCQKQIDKIEKINIQNIMEKHFDCDYYSSTYRSYDFEVETTINRLISSRISKNESLEKTFSNLGKNLDDYINKQKILSELKDKITIEKQKLGIK